MKKALITALAGLAAGTALSFAAPANAYSGPCYTDSFGRCSYAPSTMMTLQGSPGDRAAYGVTDDQAFAYFVTHDDNAPNFIITDFDGLKAQALRACQIRSSGLSRSAAIQDLQNLVPSYSRNVAANIVISGSVVYCDWVIDMNKPSYPVA